jgi:hypothetical protein
VLRADPSWARGPPTTKLNCRRYPAVHEDGTRSNFHELLPLTQHSSRGERGFDGGSYWGPNPLANEPAAHSFGQRGRWGSLARLDIGAPSVNVFAEVFARQIAQTEHGLVLEGRIGVFERQG